MVAEQYALSTHAYDVHGIVSLGGCKLTSFQLEHIMSQVG